MTKPPTSAEPPQAQPSLPEHLDPAVEQSVQDAEGRAEPAPLNKPETAPPEQPLPKPPAYTARPVTLRRRLTVMGRRTKRFVLDEWQISLSLGGLLASALLARPFAGSLTDQFVYAGAILQVAGVLTVALGLHETRRLFEQPSIVRKFMKIFESPRDILLQVEGASIGMSAMNATLTVGRKAGRKTAERMAALEAEIDEIRKLIRDAEKTRKKELAELRTALGAEASERGKGDKTLEKKIQSAVIGGLRLEYAGVSWLLAGVISSTIPAFAIWITYPLRAVFGLS